MNWSDERYVRIYTRDTTSWLLWSWQAQALFCLLLRKADRTGAIDLGAHGKRGVCAHVKMPWEVAEGALDELLTDGCLQVRNETSTDRNAKTILVFPNYVAAQEAVASSKLRQQRWREKDPNRNETSTDGDVSLRNVDAARRGETRGDSVPSRTVPSRAVPSRTVPPEEACRAGAPDAPVRERKGTGAGGLVRERVSKEREQTAAFLEWFNRKWGRAFQVRPEAVRLVSRLLVSGFGQGDMRAVAAHLAEQWGDDAKMAKYIQPSTVLTKDKFGERLDAALAANPALAAKARAMNAEYAGGMANGSSLPTVPEAGADERMGSRVEDDAGPPPTRPLLAAVDGVRSGRVP